MVDNDTQEVKGFWLDIRAWVDSHPRTGWYISVVVTLNLLLHILELFK